MKVEGIIKYCLLGFPSGLRLFHLFSLSSHFLLENVFIFYIHFIFHEHFETVFF